VFVSRTPGRRLAARESEWPAEPGNGLIRWFFPLALAPGFLNRSLIHYNAGRPAENRAGHCGDTMRIVTGILVFVAFIVLITAVVLPRAKQAETIQS
jgi:hypothetical protein